MNVSTAKMLENVFRESLVIELIWENSIEFKMIEKNIENIENLSRLTLARKFFSKLLRNLIR